MERIKGWFKNSEVIFLARLEAASGLVIAALSGTDWSPLLGLTEFKPNQTFYIGSVMFVKGIITELARRRNATDIK